MVKTMIKDDKISLILSKANYSYTLKPYTGINYKYTTNVDNEQFIYSIRELCWYFGPYLRYNNISIINIIKNNSVNNDISWMTYDNLSDSQNYIDIINKIKKDIYRVIDSANRIDLDSDDYKNELKIQKHLSYITSEIHIEMILNSRYRKLAEILINRYIDCMHLITFNDLSNCINIVENIDNIGFEIDVYDEESINSLIKIYGSLEEIWIARLIYNCILYELKWTSNDDICTKEANKMTNYISSLEGYHKRTLNYTDITFLIYNFTIGELSKLIETNFLDKSEWPYQGSLQETLYRHLKPKEIQDYKIQKMELLDGDTIEGLSFYKVLSLNILIRTLKGELEYRSKNTWAFKKINR